MVKIKQIIGFQEPIKAYKQTGTRKSDLFFVNN
jgi:hypothetical protein